MSESRYAALVREAKVYLDAERPLPFTLGRELIVALNNAETVARCNEALAFAESDPVVASTMGEPTV